MSDHLTIFYSWQNDLPAKENRSFVEGALKKAIKILGKSEDDLEKAERELRFDKDTSGVPGSPAIVETILGKISGCAIFVPDLTFTGQTRKGRPVQNANVLIEYGWAMAHLEDSQIVAVMNTAYGEPTKETMPFDLVHKRYPIQYCLKEGEDTEKRKEVREKLVSDLRDALKLALDNATPKQAKVQETPRLEHKSRRTSFLEDGEDIGFVDFDLHNDPMKIQWKDGTQYFLRVFPETDSTAFKRSELCKRLERVADPFVCPRHVSSWRIKNEPGMAWVEASGSEDQRDTSRVFQITKYGEIWSIDAKTLSQTEGSILFPEKLYAETLAAYMSILRDNLGLQGTFHIEAGYSGIAGMPCFRPPLTRNVTWVGYETKFGRAIEDEIVTEISGVSFDPDRFLKVSYDGSKYDLHNINDEELARQYEHAYKVLIPFFDDFFENLGAPRYEFLPR